MVFKPQTDNDIILEDKVIAYKQVVGFAIYLANNTRPNISYAIR